MEINFEDKEKSIIVIDEIETKKDEADTLEFIDQKLQMCVDILGINENTEAIQKLTDYIINPHKITELINEDDIFLLFIEKFRKTIK